LRSTSAARVNITTITAEPQFPLAVNYIMYLHYIVNIVPASYQEKNTLMLHFY